MQVLLSLTALDGHTCGSYRILQERRRPLRPQTRHFTSCCANVTIAVTPPLSSVMRRTQISCPGSFRLFPPTPATTCAACLSSSEVGLCMYACLAHFLLTEDSCQIHVQQPLQPTTRPFKSYAFAGALNCSEESGGRSARTSAVDICKVLSISKLNPL